MELQWLDRVWLGNFIQWLDRVWATPCMAAVPHPFHGLCRMVPVIFVMFGLVGVMGLLSLTNPKPATADAPTAAASAAPTTKKKKAKKTD